MKRKHWPNNRSETFLENICPVSICERVRVENCVREHIYWSVVVDVCLWMCVFYLFFLCFFMCFFDVCFFVFFHGDFLISALMCVFLIYFCVCFLICILCVLMYFKVTSDWWKGNQILPNWIVNSQHDSNLVTIILFDSPQFWGLNFQEITWTGPNWYFFKSSLSWPDFF